MVRASRARAHGRPAGRCGCPGLGLGKEPAGSGCGGRGGSGLRLRDRRTARLWTCSRRQARPPRLAAARCGPDCLRRGQCLLLRGGAEPGPRAVSVKVRRGLAAVLPPGVRLPGTVGARSGAPVACLTLAGRPRGSVRPVAIAAMFHFVLAPGEGARDAVLVALAYPVADLLLLVLLAGAFAVLGWRVGLRWGLLATGLLWFSGGDVWFLLQSASSGGTRRAPGWTSPGWWEWL